MNLRFVRFHKKQIAVTVFLIFMIIIHIIKPKLIYNDQGSFRHFGVGYREKTIFPIWLISIILSILSYLLVLFVLQT